jgi:hypothetical protein
MAGRKLTEECLVQLKTYFCYDKYSVAHSTVWPSLFPIWAPGACIDRFWSTSLFVV